MLEEAPLLTRCNYSGTMSLFSSHTEWRLNPAIPALSTCSRLVSLLNRTSFPIIPSLSVIPRVRNHVWPAVPSSSVTAYSCSCDS